MSRKRIYSLVGIVVILAAIGIASATDGGIIEKIIQVATSFDLTNTEIQGGGNLAAAHSNDKATVAFEGNGGFEYKDHGQNLDIKADAKDIILVAKTMDGMWATEFGYLYANGKEEPFILLVGFDTDGKGKTFAIGVPDISYFNGGSVGGNIHLSTD